MYQITSYEEPQNVLPLECAKRLQLFAPNGVLYVFMGFTAVITDMVLYARSQDSLMSVLMCIIDVVFSNVELKGGGKPCHKTC